MRGNFFYKRVGERIFTERKKRNLSQERLSLLSDIDRTYITRIEAGRANPSIKVLRKISRVLKIKMNKLIKGV
jgi:transcriptional regulator with XRE-family HTH domain